MDKNKTIRYTTEIRIIQDSIKKLNKQFSLCDVLVCYHGDNRNMTSLSKKVIEDNLYSIYGIPIVGEWVYKLDGTDEKTWGSHGGKIIIDDNGIHFEQTTKPFGFVTKDAAESATWVTITEKDGHTQHEYLKLSGCILWTSRYEESKSILDENFGQSMEISIENGSYRDDNYYDITKFVFSALCLLGTDVEPCFESANVSRHYEFDKFKKEFQLMLDEYKESTSKKDGDIDKKKKGELLMKLDLDKVTTLLSTYKFKDKTEKETNKYALLGASEDNILVLDIEDEYKVFAFKYALDESEEVIVDFDSKVEHVFTTVEKEKATEEIIDVFAKTVDGLVDTKVEVLSMELEQAYNAKIDEMSVSYEDLNKSFSVATEKLAAFEKAESEKKKELHKDEVDAIINRYSSKLGKYSKFLIYKAKIKYDEIEVEDVEKDLALMAGYAMMESSDKKNFSYTPMESKITKQKNESSNRYGNLLDKFKDMK